MCEERYMSSTQKNVHELEISVSGMSCASCAGRVEKALLKVPGVEKAAVNLVLETAVVHTADRGVHGDQLVEAIQQAGYSAAIKFDESASLEQEKAKEAALKREKISIAWAALLSLPLIAPMIFMPFGWHWALPGWIQLALAAPVQFYLGRRFYKAAFP
ncbi:MAG: cation-translocating P-type ATPase [Proteobacteria bacterium]|nr:MAG: cation-translocating P-type ATPase [Pseudomonadota bacterium]